MHLLVDISAHGLGHLAQTAPVLAALRALSPELRLTVRSALPRSRLELRIGGDFDHIAEARDFGFVMHNAVDIDFAVSARRYLEFHRDWNERVRTETGWLKAKAIDAVLTNVAYLPLAAAAQAGIPSASLCSLNWADLFFHYFAAEPWAAKPHAEMHSAYNAATIFLRVSPGLPMAGFERCRPIGPVAHIGRRNRPALARRLGIAEEERWVLLAMGGMEFRLPVDTWPHAPGLKWLVPAAWNLRRDDVRSFDSPGIAFADVLAGVDAVVTKPGYGTFVEAACGGIPILYMERPDWPETPCLTAWLDEHARSCPLSRTRLMRGDFGDELVRLWNREAPSIPLATGAEEAAGLLRSVLGL